MTPGSSSLRVPWSCVTCVIPFSVCAIFQTPLQSYSQVPPPLRLVSWRSSFNLHPIFRSLVLVPPASNASPPPPHRRPGRGRPTSVNGEPVTLPNLPRSQGNLLPFALKCLRGCERMPPSAYAADQRASTSAISDIFISFLHNGSRSVVYEIKRLKRKSLD